MVKGYYPPRKIDTGICFICGEKCNPDNYCHFKCAIAYSDEKGRRGREAIEKVETEQIKQEKKWEQKAKHQ